MTAVEVAIVGGGIAGVTTALFLAEAGVSVCVLERGEIASEASGVNAGMIDAPGDPGGADLNATLKNGSIELFRQLQVERGFDLGFRRSGQLVVMRADAELRWAASLDLADGVELLERGELLALEPQLGPSVRGALRSPGAGQAEPALATRAFARAAVEAGAVMATGNEVLGLAKSGDGWRVAASEGSVDADVVVLAAGAWSSEVAAMVGLRLPMAPVRGQMWATGPQPPSVHHTIAGLESGHHWAHHEPTTPPEVTHVEGVRVARHLYGRQRANGEVVFGGDRLPGGAAPPDPEGIAANRAHATEVLPFLADLPVVRTWSGVMPFTTDGRPLIGAVSERPGLFVVGGLASSGFGRGPMAGRLVADLIVTGEAPPELAEADPSGRVTEVF